MHVKGSTSYNFKTEGIGQAKMLGDKEALKFLLNITQELHANESKWKIDTNKNYHFIPEPDSTPLMIACCNNNTRLIKFLLEEGADPNVHTEQKFTSLIYACRNIRHFMIRMLQSYNADISAANLFNETVLHWACITGSIKVVQIILSNSPELINLRTNIGKTPLHIASDQGHLIQVVEQLLQAQADPNIQTVVEERNFT